MKHMVTLPDGTKVPALGQGTWYLGEKPAQLAQEEKALRSGIDAGMTLIDTAEMYGSGLAETLVGKAIRGYDREKLFLVSKVYPHNAGRKNMRKSCEHSLRRMGTEYLDLYLLHWRGSIPFAETVECMEQLMSEGKIRRWGVSNLDTDDMEELWRLSGGKQCAVDQVLYHLGSRGIEFDLKPWLAKRGVPVMAYCPLAQGGSLKRGLYGNETVREIAQAHSATVSQILLAFAIRDGSTIAIPRTGKAAHTLENAGADRLELAAHELAALDEAFPAPKRKVWLDMQ